MRIAISTDGNNVSAHFGRCPSFTIIDLEGNKVVKKESLDNPGHEPGRIPQFLHSRGVVCIIAGGMGRRAEALFYEMDIQTIVGISGSIDETIEELKKGELKGGQSSCRPGSGKGYGLDKTQCDHPKQDNCDH